MELSESVLSDKGLDMKRAIFTALALCVLLVPGWAQGDDRESPFVRKSDAKPPAPPAKIPASPLDNIEFRGVTVIGGVAWFSLWDPKNKKSYRVSEGVDGEDGFSLVSYDPGNKPGEETIVVRNSGLSKKLSLKDADIIALAAPRPVAQPATQQSAPRAPGPPRPAQPANPSIQAASDEEVRERMQRVAEEIRRRRSLRRDIIEDGSSGSN